MYGNNDINQIGGEGDARPCALPRACTRAPAPLPFCKLVTNGSGKVWAVDENGKPLGIFTKSQATFENTGVERKIKTRPY